MASTASPRVVLALIVVTCVLMSMLGTVVFAFGGMTDSPSQFLKLLWIGPLLALPVLGLIAISRKVLIPAGIALLMANYLGSLVFMNGECASGACLPTHSYLLVMAQVLFDSLCTPQSGLSLILVVLGFVYRRSEYSQVSIP